MYVNKFLYIILKLMINICYKHGKNNLKPVTFLQNVLFLALVVFPDLYLAGTSSQPLKYFITYDYIHIFSIQYNVCGLF